MSASLSTSSIHLGSICQPRPAHFWILLSHYLRPVPRISWHFEKITDNLPLKSIKTPRWLEEVISTESFGKTGPDQENFVRLLLDCIAELNAGVSVESPVADPSLLSIWHGRRKRQTLLFLTDRE